MTQSYTENYIRNLIQNDTSPVSSIKQMMDDPYFFIEPKHLYRLDQPFVDAYINELQYNDDVPDSLRGVSFKDMSNVEQKMIAKMFFDYEATGVSADLNNQNIFM